VNILSDKPEFAAIPLCVPSIHGNEWAYIKECLDTNWVSTAGPFVEKFEREFASFIGVDHAVAISSGTAALHVALIAADVQPNDEVLVSDLTFIAPVNAVRYVDAWPVFIDASPDTWQMDPLLLTKFLDEDCVYDGTRLLNKTSGRRISAIVPVHILGHPVDMGPVIEIAKKYQLPVIEDATESLGANDRGRNAGTLGAIGCFSFNGNKLMTTGGGGMVVTENASLAARMRHLSTQAKYDPIESIHNEIGFNYRLTNIQAAMGCAQLERIGVHVEAKRRIAQNYDSAFKAIAGIQPMPRAEWAESVCWMYTVTIDAQQFGMDRHTLMQCLSDVRIQTRPLWQPMHLSPAHSGAEVLGGGVAEGLYQNALSLPCSVDLSDTEQANVILAIEDNAAKNGNRLTQSVIL
jgi:perosamine synthetase